MGLQQSYRQKRWHRLSCMNKPSEKNYLLPILHLVYNFLSYKNEEIKNEINCTMLVAGHHLTLNKYIWFWFFFQVSRKVEKMKQMHVKIFIFSQFFDANIFGKVAPSFPKNSKDPQGRGDVVSKSSQLVMLERSLTGGGFLCVNPNITCTKGCQQLFLQTKYHL